MPTTASVATSSTSENPARTAMRNVVVGRALSKRAAGNGGYAVIAFAQALSCEPENPGFSAIGKRRDTP